MNHDGKLRCRVQSQEETPRDSLSSNQKLFRSPIFASRSGIVFACAIDITNAIYPLRWYTILPILAYSCLPYPIIAVD